MAKGKSKTDWDMERHYQLRVRPQLKQAPWRLLVTEHKDKPPPLFVVKELLSPEDEDRPEAKGLDRPVLKERGLLYGEVQQRCLPIIRTIVGRVNDQDDVPLDLARFLPKGRITFRDSLPLDEEAGAKLALIFRLREKITDMDRIELIARRVDRFTREEAVYWHSRITNFDPIENRWAMAGMKLMLGGQPGDAHIQEMLERLR